MRGRPKWSSRGPMPEAQPSDPEGLPRAAATRQPTREGIYRLSVAHFLFALVLLLVTEPFVEQLAYGISIEAALLALVLLSAVLAVGGRRRMLVLAVVLVTPAVVGTWVDHFRPDLVPIEVTLVASIVFVAFVVERLLSFILRSPRVNS